MMRFAFVLILCSLFCLGCKHDTVASSDESAEVDLHSPQLPQVKAVAERIERMCDDIYMKNNQFVELYCEYLDSPELVPVTGFDDVNKSRLRSTYNLIRYPNGNPMNIVEIPYVGRGGLYDNVYSSFFDESGSLVKFVRSSGFLLDDKSQFSETSESFYDNTHTLIRKTYRLRDDLDSSRVVNPREVISSPGRIDYVVYTNLAEFYMAHPIVN